MPITMCPRRAPITPKGNAIRTKNGCFLDGNSASVGRLDQFSLGRLQFLQALLKRSLPFRLRRGDCLRFGIEQLLDVVAENQTVPRNLGPVFQNLEAGNHEGPVEKVFLWPVAVELIKFSPHHEAGRLDDLVDGRPVVQQRCHEGADVSFIDREIANKCFAVVFPGLTLFFHLIGKPQNQWIIARNTFTN